MAVRAPPAMSLDLSASMVEVAAMSEFAFCKRFRSSYESSLSVSSPDLPLRKHYRGTSELVEDSEEDEEIEESMDSDSVSEDAEDEGPITEDEDPAAEDEGLTAGVEGPSMHDEGYGLDDESHGMDDGSRGIDDEGHSVESDRLGLEKEEEAVLEGQQQATPVMGTAGFGSAPESEIPERVSVFRQPTLTTWTDPEDGIVYIDVPTYPPPAPPIQIQPSPEWTSGSLPISPSHSDVPSPISSPIIPLTVPFPVATPAAVETEGFLTELGAQVEMQGGLTRDHLAEERRAGLELAEVVNDMRREQEPRGDAYGIRVISLRAQFCPCIRALRLVARDREARNVLGLIIFTVLLGGLIGRQWTVDSHGEYWKELW
ncbi:hypothetical protein Tco_0098107 [Tanacetum coccineum]